MKTTFTFPNLDTVITARNKRESSMAWIFVNQLNSAVEYMRDKDYNLGQKIKRGDAEWFWEELGGQASAMYFLGMVPEPFGSVTIARACRRTFNDTASAGDKIPDYLI